MKRTTVALTAALSLLLAGSTFAQDVKEIVKKHNEAVGGAENWAKVKSLRKEGTMSIMGMDMPVVFTTLKGKGMRQEFNVMGKANYIVVTPAAGWMFMPAQGHTEAVPMPAEQLK
ncbi:MAG: hypothetical protein EOP49_28220, partial [Sphingobacteriales bacterium]